MLRARNVAQSVTMLGLRNAPPSRSVHRGRPGCSLALPSPARCVRALRETQSHLRGPSFRSPLFTHEGIENSHRGTHLDQASSWNFDVDLYVTVFYQAINFKGVLTRNRPFQYRRHLIYISIICPRHPFHSLSGPVATGGAFPIFTSNHRRPPWPIRTSMTALTRQRWPKTA